MRLIVRSMLLRLGGVAALLAFCPILFMLAACEPAARSAETHASNLPADNVSPFAPRLSSAGELNTSAPKSGDTSELLWNRKQWNGELAGVPEGPNLIPDPTFNDLHGQWAVKFYGDVRVQEVEVTSQTLSIGVAVRALHIRTDQRCEVTPSRPIMVHSAQQAYQLRLWDRVDPPDAGLGTFGLQAFDAAGAPLNVLAQGGRPLESVNADFTTIDLGYPSWNVQHHYLMPVDARHTWAEPRDSVGRSFQAPTGLATLLPRFNYTARDGEPVDIWLALPVVQAVKFEAPTPRHAP